LALNLAYKLSRRGLLVLGWLLKHGACELSEVAKGLGLDVSEVREALRELTQEGVVDESYGVYYALPVPGNLLLKLSLGFEVSEEEYRECIEYLLDKAFLEKTGLSRAEYERRYPESYRRKVVEILAEVEDKYRRELTEIRRRLAEHTYNRRKPVGKQLES